MAEVFGQSVAHFKVLRGEFDDLRWGGGSGHFQARVRSIAERNSIARTVSLGNGVREL
jgi:hypothetical protein